MDGGRRSSRADRRKRTGTYTGEERRRGPAPQVTVYSQIAGTEVQVFVQNPIVSENCSGAREQLLRHAQRSQSPVVVVDMSKSTYIDTPGLSTIFEVKRLINAQGRAFYLQNPSRCVQRMLNITRMVRVFPIRFTQMSDVQAIPTAKGNVAPEQPGMPAVPPGSPMDTGPILPPKTGAPAAPPKTTTLPFQPRPVGDEQDDSDDDEAILPFSPAPIRHDQPDDDAVILGAFQAMPETDQPSDDGSADDAGPDDDQPIAMFPPPANDVMKRSPLPDPDFGPGKQSS